MSLALDRIHRGDCLEGLAKLAADSVDLAFADPPFNIGYDYDVYDDRRESEDYLAWSRRWITAVKRVLKPNGTFWLAIGDEYAAELKVICTRDLGLHCRSWVVWFYTFGVHCKYKFTRSHAHLLYFVRDPKDFTFNSLAIRVPSARELVYADKRADPKGRVPDDTWMMTPVSPPEVPTADGFTLRPQDIPDRFPANSDTWYFSRVAGTFNERSGWHGCQMPEQLLGRIIKACSNEGDTVLDPFAGSGTTLVVAKKLKRRFIGFEVSKDYARKIERRLEGAKAGDALNGPENPAVSAPRTKKGQPLKQAKPRARVSRSPVVTKVNVSLGQVAVANSEYATAVAEAFMAAHQGYSADRVLADPSLNETFLDNCRVLGIPGEARDWNHLLLNIRKQGGLTAIDTSRRTLVTRDQMEPYIFASEIAWRKVSQDADCSLDEMLCDPRLCRQFDELASQIAPGYSAFQCRWGALSVRKDASKGNPLLDRTRGFLEPRIVRLSHINRLPEAPGHYLITTAHAPFFVGFAYSLRGCELFKPDRLAAAVDVMGHRSDTELDAEIRTRTFDYGAIKKAGGDVQAVACKAARRARLLKRFDPIANIPLSSPAA